MSNVMVKKPDFSHLVRLSTSRGLYEHALFNEAREEHGYCVDDVARGFVLLCRETKQDQHLLALENIYLDFVLEAIAADGSCHNRMNAAGKWTDIPSTSDWWGRAVWATGVGAVHGSTPQIRNRSLEGFRLLTRLSTADRMALAFAALGAGELLILNPKEAAAREILLLAELHLQPKVVDVNWLWPEPRLRYCNGAVVEAILIAGWALRDMALLERGLAMLKFLLVVETHEGHFSVTPPEGRGSGDPKPAFDQQPIEVAALVAAAARAWEYSGNPRWLVEVERGWNWFLGSNDGGVQMFSPETGGGYDGLTQTGPNLNQGAESTISMLSTAQWAGKLQDLFLVS